jgi:hypothetical protein
MSFVTIIGYFLNYFSCLVVFVTILLLMCFFIFLFNQFLTWFSFNNTHLCSISCEYGQMNYNPMCIQSVFAYFKMYGFIMMYNMYFIQ